MPDTNLVEANLASEQKPTDFETLVPVRPHEIGGNDHRAGR